MDPAHPTALQIIAIGLLIIVPVVVFFARAIYWQPLTTRVLALWLAGCHGTSLAFVLWLRFAGEWPNAYEFILLVSLHLVPSALIAFRVWLGTPQRPKK